MANYLYKLISYYGITLFLELFNLAQSQYKDNANLLCTQMLNTGLLEKCCGDTKASNLPFLKSNCEKYKDNFGACRHECIFDHFRMLHPNGSLTILNTSDMIEEIYPSNSDYHTYGVILLESYEHCEALSSTFPGLARMHASLSEHDAGVNKEGFKCNKRAMMYTKCAIGNMFLNCPVDHWQYRLEDCAASRRLLSHCVTFLHGIDDINSRGKLRTRSASQSLKRQRLLSTGLSFSSYPLSLFYVRFQIQ